MDDSFHERDRCMRSAINIDDCFQLLTSARQNELYTFHVYICTLSVQCMAFLSSAERSFLKAVSQLAYCNPFLPERTEFERAVLGSEFVEGEPIWSRPMDDPERPRTNVL